MRGKKGQFFILAAIIIAAVIFGLAVTENILSGNEKPEDFYLLGNQIQEELNSVIDYSTFSGNDNVSDFINQTINYVKSSKAPTEIVFIYVNNGNISVENYAKNVTSIYGFGSCPISSPCPVYSGNKGSYLLDSSKIINISIGSEKYFYNLTEGSKSYIVLKRTIGREVYIDVKK